MRKILYRFIGITILFTLLPIVFFYHNLATDLSFWKQADKDFDFFNLDQSDADASSLRCMQFPENLSSSYPDCLTKMQWLKNGWKLHPCYGTHGVDGSVCSYRHYLSLVEHCCPAVPRQIEETLSIIEPNYDIQKLFNLMEDNPVNFKYMKDRIGLLWPTWTNALTYNFSKYPSSMKYRKRLNVLVHLGFLMSESKLHFGAKSSNGGPLGELLQWSDLIAVLFLLGHNLYISSEKATLKKHVERFIDSPCPTDLDKIDLIITDIIGLQSFKQHKAYLLENRCRIRLVDSFGTHVEFNYKSYFNSHRQELRNEETGKSRNPWGGHGLRLLQYWTFYPHTADNSFLGFVVDTSNAKPLFERRSRNALLIYGKEQYMWKGSEKIISVLKQFTEIHATVSDATVNSTMFTDIINHGFLDAVSVNSLLKSVKIFFGLGFPFEGPAPLEAIANGAVFINPRFNPPKSRKNTAFFAEKPTLREWTSQCPYMERIGPPHVYTIDINNDKILRDTIKMILEKEPPPFVPEEFTPSGMLLRVNLLISRQNICRESENNWPPKEALQIRKAEVGQSCELACSQEDLVCEPTFFPLINTYELLVKNSLCTEKVSLPSVFAPYNCTLQSNPALFSCSSKPPLDKLLSRLCPCRDHIPGHSSLCSICI